MFLTNIVLISDFCRLCNLAQVEAVNCFCRGSNRRVPRLAFHSLNVLLPFYCIEVDFCHSYVVKCITGICNGECRRLGRGLSLAISHTYSRKLQCCKMLAKLV